MTVTTAKSQLEQVREFMDLVPFNQFLGLQVDELGDGYAKMSAPFREELIGDPFRRALHGGVLAAMIDTCGGAAVWTQCASGDRLSTVDMRADYLRPGRTETIVVEARVLRLGNRVGVTDIVAYHLERSNKPIATGKAVYNIRRSGGATKIA